MSKEDLIVKAREYYQAHKEEVKSKKKTYYKAHKEEIKAYKKAYKQAHKEELKAYQQADVNGKGETKSSIRRKSQYYLKKYGTKIPGYEIHHCCTYTEPYKFIYCSKEIHKLIHSYLKQHNIDADSDHYEYIKHLLDDSVLIYGV